ncbi:YtxH domain-containing protein [Candidatus Saccharibacteria bacterium]|jgi:gas vesicle protein|nr:YtxH domain-containing protein [Candidatus Saccharibacteria bacterium]
MSNKKVAKAGIIGAIAGAVAGIFVLAPKGAKENREDLKNAARDGKADLEKKLKAQYKELGKLVDEARSRLDTLKGQAKDDSQDLVKQADRVKGKLKELISNVRDDASDVADEAGQTVNEVTELIKKLKLAAQKEVKDAKASHKK